MHIHKYSVHERAMSVMSQNAPHTYTMVTHLFCPQKKYEHIFILKKLKYPNGYYVVITSDWNTAINCRWNLFECTCTVNFKLPVPHPAMMRTCFLVLPVSANADFNLESNLSICLCLWSPSTWFTNKKEIRKICIE